MLLKELRKCYGYEKQKDFARAINQNVTTVAMWECGKSKPSIFAIKTIAKILNAPYEEVINCFDK